VRRIASTLVRSTERDICEHRERSRNAEDREVALPDDEASQAVHALRAATRPGGEGEDAWLYARLQSLLGSDADLVAAVVLYGDTFREAAHRLGLPPETARKRFQRAMARLRRQAPGMSQTGPFDPRLSGERARGRMERKRR
jgi:RNA polymerase sigma-70 factor (ECF subfamily)